MEEKERLPERCKKQPEHVEDHDALPLAEERRHLLAGPGETKVRQDQGRDAGEGEGGDFGGRLAMW